MDNYVVLSLETHLFFARIMKEHALFLEAGFPCVNKAWIEKAGCFRKEFEKLLQETICISDGQICASVLDSRELSTEFTIAAEKRTHCLTGIPINSDLTKQEQMLCPGFGGGFDRRLCETVSCLNQRAFQLLQEFICFKENILCEVKRGQLFTSNYPTMIHHLILEAQFYQGILKELLCACQPPDNTLADTEEFWNHIMKEHALFMRGLLDPSESKLILTANQFALDYEKLLSEAYLQENFLPNTETALEKTLEFRDFKAAGVNGILNCEISSLILPLLADHVLREANHYIRLLESTQMR